MVFIVDLFLIKYHCEGEIDFFYSQLSSIVYNRNYTGCVYINNCSLVRTVIFLYIAYLKRLSLELLKLIHIYFENGKIILSFVYLPIFDMSVNMHSNRPLVITDLQQFIGL